MSSEIIAATGSQDEPRPEPGDRGRREDRDNKNDGIPTAQDCLRAIAALPGLTAIGKITPQKANSIRADYEAILRAHDRARQGPTVTIRDEDVLRVFANHPEDIELLQPLLTREQLDLLMRNMRDEQHR
jgi:hypothetical protein